MKIKRLKKVLIGSAIWKIEWVKNSDNGSFDYVTEIIKIPAKGNTEVRIFEILMHELKEIIQCEQFTRLYGKSTEQQYVFVYNHDQHTDLCARLSGLLSKFIK